MKRSDALKIGGWVGLVALVAAVSVVARDHSTRCRTKAPEEGPGVTHVDLHARVWHVAVGPQGFWAVLQRDTARQSGQLVELDPTTGKIKGAAIELPAVGWALAVGKTRIWVVTSRITAHPVGILHEVDPKKHRIVASFRVGRGTSSVSEGEGGVWVTNPGNKNVLRVDVEHRKVLTRTRIEDGPDLVFARDGAVWVGTRYGSGAVHRIDPKTGRDVGSAEGFLANVGAGAVWVTANGPPNGQVRKLDPTALERSLAIRGLDILPAEVGIAGDEVWVGEFSDYCLANTPQGAREFAGLSMGWYRVDPRTLKPISGPVHIGENRGTPVFAGGAFWLIEESGFKLIRIDLATAAKVRP